MKEIQLGFYFNFQQNYTTVDNSATTTTSGNYFIYDDSITNGGW